MRCGKSVQMWGITRKRNKCPFSFGVTDTNRKCNQGGVVVVDQFNVGFKEVVQTVGGERGDGACI